MKQYPDSIRTLIDKFSVLPGVGYRTAERYVYFLLRQNPDVVRDLGKAISNLPGALKYCSRCWDFSDAAFCRICSNPSRRRDTVCVVSEPYDIPAVEQTSFEGTYFVLGGVLQPLSGIGPEQLRVRELLDLGAKETLKEVILALNPDKDGEATALFIASKLRGLSAAPRVTRIAKGLPLGSAVEYADEVSLGAAMENRQEL